MLALVEQHHRALLVCYVCLEMNSRHDCDGQSKIGLPTTVSTWVGQEGYRMAREGIDHSTHSVPTSSYGFLFAILWKAPTPVDLVS